MSYRAQSGWWRGSEIDAVLLFLHVSFMNGLVPRLRDGFLLYCLMAKEGSVIAGEISQGCRRELSLGKKPLKFFVIISQLCFIDR